MPGQTILSIDASVHPAWLQVAEIEGRTVTVVESHRADLHEMFHPRNVKALLSRAGGQAAETARSGVPEESEQAQPAATDVSPPSDDSTRDWAFYSALLKEELAKITTPYTASVLIVPTNDYLSMNLDLPFGDSRQLAKILDLEVQDRVPFEIDEFLIEHRALSEFPASSTHRGHDIHVSIVPRPLMAGIIRLCKGASFEPLIVTTVSSILEGLFILAPDYFRPDAAALLVRDSYVHLALRFDGRVRADRVIDLRSLADTHGDRAKALSTELRLTFLAAESRYERKIGQVYLIGDEISDRDLQQYLGREVETVRLSELIISPTPDNSIAALAAPFAQDQEPPPILTNFRTKEFSYSLQLSELFTGLRRLVPMFLVVVATLVILLVGSYYNRENQISAMQQEMRSAIENLLPGTPIEPGSEVNAIQAENSKLDKALESLGSGSLDQFTALDILRELAAAMPATPGIIIRSVNIRGNRVRLQGSAPAYKDVEDIQKALRRNRGIKFRAKQPDLSAAIGTVPGGAKAAQNFTFDITVEE